MPDAFAASMLTLWEVATELSHRLIGSSVAKRRRRAPVYGGDATFQHDPHFRDYVLFYEYFHGETGRGLGASHQTGWTALVAKLIQQCAEYCGQHKPPLDDGERLTEATSR